MIYDILDFLEELFWKIRAFYRELFIGKEKK